MPWLEQPLPHYPKREPLWPGLPEPLLPEPLLPEALLPEPLLPEPLLPVGRFRHEDLLCIQSAKRPEQLPSLFVFSLFSPQTHIEVYVISGHTLA